MNKLKIFIPSAFTLGNLFCGFIGIQQAFLGHLDWAFYMILLAGFLDFFDGLLARKLGVDGDFGKELDSLADVVSFGVVPSFIFFSIMQKGGIFVDFLKPLKSYTPYFSGMIALASAWRLAKFNIDESQTTSFKGLATPANAILIGSMGLSYQQMGFYYPIVWFNEACILIILLLTWLLNSNKRLLSLKFSNFSFADNKYRYLLILCSFISVIFYSFEAVPLILVLYIIISTIHFKTSNEV